MLGLALFSTLLLRLSPQERVRGRRDMARLVPLPVLTSLVAGVPFPLRALYPLVMRPVMAHALA